MMNPVQTYHSSFSSAELCSLDLTLNKHSKIKALHQRKKDAINGIFALSSADSRLKFVQIFDEDTKKHNLVIPESLQGNIKNLIHSQGRKSLIIETNDHDVFIADNVFVDDRIHNLRRRLRS